MSVREFHLVELVSANGTPAGTATVREAHTAPGLLHRAFSVLLFDPDGRVLLQQRAGVKTRFPLRWANTCCGHPGPGVTPTEAANERLREELGLTGLTLTEAGVYTYAAADPSSGLVEREYDHVLIGRVPAGLTVEPDPAEVASTRWAPAEALLAEVSDDTYAPWLAGVLPIALARAAAQ
jgi:isopentenyl-diphosphate delta-isomerase